MAATLGTRGVPANRWRVAPAPVSHRHVQQLSHVEQNLLAVQQAVSTALTDAAQPGYGRLQIAFHDLETTYLTRLFSEFEALLRNEIRANHPRRRVPRTVSVLIDRVASLHSLPDQVRDDAHKVRVYRNSVVHDGSATVSAITFRQSARYLYHYLSILP